MSSWYIISESYIRTIQVIIPVRILSEQHEMSQMCSLSLAGKRYTLRAYLKANPCITVRFDEIDTPMHDIVITAQDLHLPVDIQLLHYSTIAITKLV